MVINTNTKPKFILSTECPICLESYAANPKNAFIMPWKCLHSVCMVCYTQYQTDKCKSCVLCRSEVNDEEYDVTTYSYVTVEKYGMFIPAMFKNKSYIRRNYLQQKMNKINLS